MNKEIQEWLNNLPKEDSIDQELKELYRLADVGKNVILYTHQCVGNYKYDEACQITEDLEDLIRGAAIMMNGKLCRADK